MGKEARWSEYERRKRHRVSWCSGRKSRTLSVGGTERLNDAEFDLLNTLMKQMQAYSGGPPLTTGNCKGDNIFD
jgi:hypothetical protein